MKSTDSALSHSGGPAYGTFKDDHSSNTTSTGYVTDEDASLREFSSTLRCFTWSRPKFFLSLLAVTKLMVKGNRHKLTLQDAENLSICSSSSSCEEMTRALLQVWSKAGSLAKAFFRLYHSRLALYGMVLWYSAACELLGPCVLFNVVEALESPSTAERKQRLVGWLLLLLITRFVKALCYSYAYYHMQRTALQFSSALKSAVLHAFLYSTPSSLPGFSVHQRSELYSRDISNLVMAIGYVNEIWVSALLIGCTFYGLNKLMGLQAAASGGFVIIIALLLHNFVAVAQARVFETLSALKNERMQVLHQFLHNVRAIKVLGIEAESFTKVTSLRSKEMTALKGYLLLGSVNILSVWATPVAASAATIAVHVLALRLKLSVAQAFTTIALFRVIQEPVRAVPRMVIGLFNAYVSAKRLDRNYFESQSFGNPRRYIVGREHRELRDKYDAMQVVIAVEHGFFSWSRSEMAAPLFEDLNVSISKGEFVVIHGPSGCGKSSFCSVLLGEMINRNNAYRTTGHLRNRRVPSPPPATVYVGGSVAFCPQEPWLVQHSSLRDNILFGAQFDRKRYRKVLDACKLLEEFGERDQEPVYGLQCDASQQVRICLARACYRDTDIYILDVALDKIESASMRHDIFVNCFVRLLKRKTRIVATTSAAINDFLFSKFVDDAIRLEDGRLVHTRRMQDGFRPLPISLEEEDDHERELGYSDQATPESQGEFPLVVERLFSPIRSQQQLFNTEMDPKERERASNDGGDIETGSIISSSTDDDDHDLLHDTYGFVVSLVHFAGGPRSFATLAALLSSWLALQFASDLWLSWQSEQSTQAELPPFSRAARRRSTTRFAMPMASARHFVSIYVLLLTSMMALVLIRTLFVSHFGLVTSKRLFDKALFALVHAPLTFYELSPVGIDVMTRRLAENWSSLDYRFPFAYGSFLALGCSIVGMVLFITALLRYFGLVLFAALVLGFQLARFVLVPSQQLNALQQQAQSQALAQASETIQGLHVIRSFSREQVERINSQHSDLIGTCFAVQSCIIAVNEWVALRVSLLGGFLVVFVFGVVMLHAHDTLGVGVACVLLNYSLVIDQRLESLFFSLSWLYSCQMATGQLREYMDLPVTYDSRSTHQCAPVRRFDPGQPTVMISLHDVTLRCTVSKSISRLSAVSLVLNRVTFEVRQHERVALYGLTEDGLRCLVRVLLRVEPVEQGIIKLGGVDLRRLDSHSLHHALGVVAPVVPCDGTTSLRQFLDSFHEHDDELLWDKLDALALGDKVRELPQGLLMPMTKHSLNADDRRRLCLARALLNCVDPSLLVLIIAEWSDHESVSTDFERTIEGSCDGVQRNVSELLERHCQEATIVYLCQNEQEVVQLGPHVTHSRHVDAQGRIERRQRSVG